MGMNIDNISKYEARRIIKWVQQTYPLAEIIYIDEKGTLTPIPKPKEDKKC